jgi:hypothetical protein
MKYFIAVILSIVLLVIVFKDKGCDISMIQTSYSPDGKYLAKVFIRDCGATVGFVPEVKLSRAGSPELFDKKVFSGYHTRDIHVAWAKETELEIYSPCAKEDIYLFKEHFQAVNIKHVRLLKVEKNPQLRELIKEVAENPKWKVF